MSELLKHCVGIEECSERTHGKIDGEHNCVNRNAVSGHPKNKHHHWQLTKGCFCKSPRFLKV
jgi:hypothetical protein